MKKYFVKDLKPGDLLHGELFAVTKKNRLTTRNNDPYIDIVLSDKSGSISAKIWPNDLEKCEDFSEGDIVNISATVVDHQGPQIKITHLSKIENYDMEDFQPQSENKTEEMLEKLQVRIDSVKDKDLKQIFENFRKDKETFESFQESPAAMSVHHAYKGGLLEHTLEILDTVILLSESYKTLNKDLLIAGAIFHDLGKIYEYKIDTTVQITKEGKLLGHIFMGAEQVRKYGKGINASTLDELIHMILSHHGKLEFGSPVLPKTPEAILLCMADDISAKLNMATTAIKDADSESSFTQYHRILGTELYRSEILNEIED